MSEVARRMTETKQAKAVLRELGENLSSLDAIGIARLQVAINTLNTNVAWFIAYIEAEMAIEKAKKEKA